MRDDDPADLDGDGEFDAIDMVILEESERSVKKNNSGCGVFLVLSIITLFSVCMIKEMFV
ncbi:hypothetical protein JT06_12330 [Desulfobulbus sp. Tol-SR]|jgi:hypothetical protein|nr:hypothetical protein JT06_12330 [Desulfobulbus sp. Tol-SR]